MCLTPEALALFLNLIGQSIVTSAPDIITVHATQGDVEWIAVDDHWCTNGPTITPQAKLKVSK